MTFLIDHKYKTPLNSRIFFRIFSANNFTIRFFSVLGCSQIIVTTTEAFLFISISTRYLGLFDSLALKWIFEWWILKSDNSQSLWKIRLCLSIARSFLLVLNIFLFHFFLLGFNFFFSDFFQFLCFFLHSFRVSSVFSLLTQFTIFSFFLHLSHTTNDDDHRRIFRVWRKNATMIATIDDSQNLNGCTEISFEFSRVYFHVQTLATSVNIAQHNSLRRRKEETWSDQQIQSAQLFLLLFLFVPFLGCGYKFTANLSFLLIRRLTIHLFLIISTTQMAILNDHRSRLMLFFCRSRNNDLRSACDHIECILETNWNIEQTNISVISLPSLLRTHVNGWKYCWENLCYSHNSSNMWISWTNCEFYFLIFLLFQVFML